MLQEALSRHFLPATYDQTFARFLVHSHLTTAQWTKEAKQETHIISLQSIAGFGSNLTSKCRELITFKKS